MANRMRIRDAYTKLRGPGPFSSTQRFHEGFFVFMGGPLRSYFEQLMCTMDLPDRVIERVNRESSES